MLNMRLIGSFFICFLLLSDISAQNKTSITGKVVSKTGPLEFASVQFFHESDSSKPLSTVHTDSSGNFVFFATDSGKHMLVVNLIGFFPLKKTIPLVPHLQSLDLGELKMELISKELETIMVTGKKNILEKTPQGFIINAAANLTQLGGTLTDLLRNTPTIAVDGDGNITLRGKSPMILINGRNSSFTSTDRISSASIEQIEIISNPSSQFDAAAESGIINIKLKKNRQNGFNSAFVVGSGIGAKGRFNSSALINNKFGKWNLGMAYENRFAGRNRFVNGDRESLNLSDNHFLIQRRLDSRDEKLQNYRVNVDFTPNAKNTFGFELINNHGNEANDEFLTSSFENNLKQFMSKSTRRSVEIQKEKVTEFALNYNRKFLHPGKSFSAMLSSSLGDENQHTDITSQAISENDIKYGNQLLQKTRFDEKTHIINVKADYVQPLSDNHQLLTGVKSTLRYLDADYQTLDEKNGIFIPNASVSNIFNFNEQIHAGYLQLNGQAGSVKSPSISYDLGVRAEKVWNDGHNQDNTNRFQNDYLKLFPSAGLTFHKGKDAFWKFSYSKRISRPGLGQLNPFIDITDSLNQHGGNPNLKPELIHSMEFGYSKDWETISIYSILYFRHSSNAIRQFTSLNANGIALTIPINFGNVNSYGIENVASMKMSNAYDFNISFSVFQQNYLGKALANETVNKVLSWNGKWINNVTPWKGGKIQITGVYNSPVATPQGRRLPIYYTDLGFQQKLGKGNGRLGLVLTDIFNTQINGYVLNSPELKFTRKSKIDTRAILLTFAYTFGGNFKEKLMENKFSND